MNGMGSPSLQRVRAVRHVLASLQHSEAHLLASSRHQKHFGSAPHVQPASPLCHLLSLYHQHDQQQDQQEQEQQQQQHQQQQRAGLVVAASLQHTRPIDVLPCGRHASLALLQPPLYAQLERLGSSPQGSTPSLTTVRHVSFIRTLSVSVALASTVSMCILHQ